MATLTELLKQGMSAYAKRSGNMDTVLATNAEETVFVVAGVANVLGERVPIRSLLAQVVSDTVVIEEDANDKMLVDALIALGVPREKIILAYAGEPVTESVLNPADVRTHV